MLYTGIIRVEWEVCVNKLNPLYRHNSGFMNVKQVTCTTIHILFLKRLRTCFHLKLQCSVVLGISHNQL